MNAAGHATFMPAPACDLIDRLAREFEIPFTLVDARGVVVASTAGHDSGDLDPHVASRAERQAPFAEEDTEVDVVDGAVYAPVRLSGRVAGFLVAHGEPARVREAALAAGISIGLALDFAETAAAVGVDTVHPGWVLYRLLRGSRLEAERARTVGAIMGWSLFSHRIAVVVNARPRDRTHEGTPDPEEVIGALLGPAARVTPFGQIDDDQWVVLMDQRASDRWPDLQKFAEMIRSELARRGLETNIGIGEPHRSRSPVHAVRRSFRDAVFAGRIGIQLSGQPGVYELRSLGPAAFFAPSSPSRRNLARLVLDPLRDHPVAVETLRVFLASNMSLGDTADRLGLHRHTIRNHLDRVTESTGSDPRTLEGAVQLKLALLVADADRAPRRPESPDVS